MPTVRTEYHFMPAMGSLIVTFGLIQIYFQYRSSASSSVVPRLLSPESIFPAKHVFSVPDL